ncbi:hypothetical protein [Micromonospora sp. NPDC023633]|uniref:hypothetical protein n=1 Tax=Micromonospora sp. NPDC023633 TaxID=3154320 RepID=UPI0033E30FF3
MGWFGTLLLARPTTATLPSQPGVREAFGSSFATPTFWGNNKLGLYDLGQGWQRVGVSRSTRSGCGSPRAWTIS